MISKNNMNNKMSNDKAYQLLIKTIKTEIRSAQIKAAVSVNTELLKLYWFLGSQIAAEQEKGHWGDGLLKQISYDLQKTFPDMKGFSHRNVKYMKQWFSFWSLGESIGQQAVAQLKIGMIFQIPWGQNLVIISKSDSQDEALFYVRKTVQNSWSRAVLTHQIESKLYQRQGKAMSNFASQLPQPLSDLAQQTLKDPYCFDFLTLSEKYNERELESALVENITQFLLELGTGFAFIGRQYKLQISNQDFYIDLLFYHIQLRCYVVIELKATDFKPEFAGKLNFYISAVDDILANEQDNLTIGLLICKSKDKIIVEYSLKNINAPVGISEYELTQQLPVPLKPSLPSIKEIEAEIEGLENE